MFIKKIVDVRKESQERKIKMENLKITPKALSKMSLIINKMGISSLIMQLNIDSGDDGKDREELAKQLIALIIDNLYKAEDEIIELISKLKGISKEEAEEVDVIPIIKELLNNEKVKDFLKLA